TRSAAGEYANMVIRINAVAPGAIATPMVLKQPQAAQDALMVPQPMHRLGTPEEYAEAVIWLVVHLLFLIGFRNRYLTLFQWAWSYLIFERGACIVSYEDEEELLSEEATRVGS
ncbi:MAG: SDR family oxidoreductase, partial [Ktedonobacteraceae bacterium]